MVSLRNNWNGIGRMTKDVEERKTNSDISVCNFTIAVDRPGTSKDNKITDFIDCTAWRQTATNICKYFHKGDPIGIHGSIQTDEYETDDGQKRKKLYILVDSYEFMPSRKNGTEQDPVPVQESTPAPEVPVDTDNLPFDRGLVYP